MAGLIDTLHTDGRSNLGNRLMYPANLAINAGSAATFKTTSSFSSYIVYSNDGRVLKKADLSAQAFSSGHTAQVAGEYCYFAICLNAAGTVSTVQGQIFTTATVDGTTYYVNRAASQANSLDKALAYPPSAAKVTDRAVFLPKVDDSLTVIGLFRADGAFTPGTTALDAATNCFMDVVCMPSVVTGTMSGTVL